jgi:hypothetical protein
MAFIAVNASLIAVFSSVVKSSEILFSFIFNFLKGE